MDPSRLGLANEAHMATTDRGQTRGDQLCPDEPSDSGDKLAIPLF